MELVIKSWFKQKEQVAKAKTELIKERENIIKEIAHERQRYNNIASHFKMCDSSDMVSSIIYDLAASEERVSYLYKKLRLINSKKEANL